MSDQFTSEELDLFRQWYDAVSDLSRPYLGQEDHRLAVRLYEICGMRVPADVREGADTPDPPPRPPGPLGPPLFLPGDHILPSGVLLRSMDDASPD